MSEIQERLRQLGDHIGVELEARRVEGNSRALHGSREASRFVHDPAERTSPGDASPGRSRFPKVLRTALTAAAATIVVTAALVAGSIRSPDRPAATDPAVVTSPLTASPDAVAAKPSANRGSGQSDPSQPTAGESYGPFGWSRAELLARVYASLDAATPDEQAVAVTGPVSENEIAVCMGEAGFQYQPFDPSSSEPRWALSPEAYAAEFGLGILAQHPSVGLYPTISDPNQVYVGSLTEGQRIAYQGAQAACAGGDLTPDQYDDRVAFLSAYEVAIEEFRGLIRADDRLRDASSTWSSCMDAAGFSFEDPFQMRSSFWTAFNTPDVDVEQRFTEEVAVAVANVPCEAAYTDVYRDVVANRFDEFITILEAAAGSGEGSDAQGAQ